MADLFFESLRRPTDHSQCSPIRAGSRPCPTLGDRHSAVLAGVHNRAAVAGPVSSLLHTLQDQALLRLLLFPGEQGRSCGVLEHFSDTLVRLCRALEVLLGTNLLAHILGLGGLVVIVISTLRILTCSGVTGFWEVLCSSSMVFWSKRKSFLQPTRMMGRPWQKWRTSEIHWGVSAGAWSCELVHHTFSWTLSSESGESMAKQMRMTCESGYERGRRRS